MFDFLISRDGQTEIIRLDRSEGHKDASDRFGSPVRVLLDYIGNVAPAIDEVTPVIERVTVSLHVVEPNLLGLSSFDKNEDGCRHPRIRLEGCGRHRDYGLQIALLKEHPPGLHM